MPSSSWDEWEEINGVLVLDDNFATLRKVLQESPPPSFPYLGMFDFFFFSIIRCFFINSFLDPFPPPRYLSDLTFKDVEQNFIDDQLVNFSKMRLLLLLFPAHFFFLTFFSPYLEHWRESL